MKNISDILKNILIVNKNVIKNNKRSLERLLMNDEITIYENYKKTNKQIQFLGGRILTKLVVSKYLSSTIDLREIEIKRDHSSLKPLLYIKGKRETSINISISHRADYIASGLSRNHLGIDLEKIDEKLLRAKHLFLSSKEESLIQSKANNKSEMLKYITMLWSSKESIVKIENLDLFYVLNNYCLEEISDNNIFYLRFNNSQETDKKRPLFKSYNYEFSGYVFSMVTIVDEKANRL